MRKNLGGHKNVVSIRSTPSDRISVQDFKEHIESMERILEAFKGDIPTDEHVARSLLREALQHVPIVADEIPSDLKDRLAAIRERLEVMDQKYRGKSVGDVLNENPKLAAYLAEQGFGPENTGPKKS